MKNVEKAFTSHGKSLDENGDEIKKPETKNVERGFEKAGSADSANKGSGHEGAVHGGRPQQERFGDQYRKVSLLDCLINCLLRCQQCHSETSGTNCTLHSPVWSGAYFTRISPKSTMAHEDMIRRDELWELRGEYLQDHFTKYLKLI